MPGKAFQLRDAEVDQFDGTILQDDDVGGFDVAVHDPARMRVAQAFADLAHDFELFQQREWVIFFDDPLEALPVQELHDDIRVAIVLAEIVDGDDVLVV